jgi:hypothetical protein
MPIRLKEIAVEPLTVHQNNDGKTHTLTLDGLAVHPFAVAPAVAWGPGGPRVSRTRYRVYHMATGLAAPGLFRNQSDAVACIHQILELPDSPWFDDWENVPIEVNDGIRDDWIRIIAGRRADRPRVKPDL